MIRQNRKIQFIILLTLVCLVATMTIAYAVLSTTLNINGTAQVMDASWNVHFDNIQVNPYSVEISPTITDNDKITFSADLTTPGQFYKFTVDIVNSGSIDAMIESVIKNPELTDEQKKYLRYEVEYLDGTSINETQLLKANETKTISVLVSYRNDIPTSNLPTTETNLDLEIRLVYVQATSLGTEIQNSDSPIKVVSGDLNTVGSEICIKDECFYLINNNGNKAMLFAKYNLHVGMTYDAATNETIIYDSSDEKTGKQDQNMKGVIGSSTIRYGVTEYSNANQQGNTYSDYNGSIVKQYVDEYKLYLESSNIQIETARLIKLDELVSLGCSKENNTCIGTYKWIYGFSYWVGTATDATHVWHTHHGGKLSDDLYNNNPYVYSFGVRPVIEIPLSEF